MSRYLTEREKLERKVREIDIEMTQYNVEHYNRVQLLMKKRLETYQELEALCKATNTTKRK